MELTQRDYEATAIAMLTALVNDDTQLSAKVFSDHIDTPGARGRLMGAMTTIAASLLADLAEATGRTQQDILQEIGQRIAEAREDGKTS